VISLTNMLWEIIRAMWKSALELSALILSIINGLMLLRSYLRDKPKLTVRPIHPDVYQWFFTLPSGKYLDQTTRRYGYLAYVSIANKGLRDVTLDSWRLHLKTISGKWFELKPVSIPEPEIRLTPSGILKAYPVLGEKGVHFKGGTMVRSGGSITGFVYYIAEFYGGYWNPLIENGKSIGKIIVRSIFGDKASTEIVFREIPIEEVRKMIKDIDNIGSKNPILTQS